MSIKRIFSALAITVDAVSSSVSTASSLLNNEINHLAKARRVDHTLNLNFSSKEKISDAATSLILCQQHNKNLIEKKAPKLKSLYEQYENEGTKLLEQMFEE